MTNTTIKLKPCPLCGSEPGIDSVIYTDDFTRMIIVCRRCGLTLDHTQHYVMGPVWSETAHTYIRQKRGVYNESAIDLWNTRVSK